MTVQIKKLLALTLFVFAFSFISVTNAFAAETLLKIDIAGGTLTMDNPTIATLSAQSLDGAVRSSAGKLGVIEVTDNRGTGSGWSVTLTVSDFTCCNNSFTIPVNNLTIVPGSVQTIMGSATGVVSGNSYTFRSADDIATILTANSNAGMGIYRINPDMTLVIPTNAFAGEYSATLTLTII